MSEVPRPIEPQSSPYVAVIGPGEAARDDLEAAEKVGGLLARRGAVIVCGGLGGVMEAACKGAAMNDGRSIGMLPGLDRSAGNAYLSIALPTGVGQMRNALIINACDAVIAIGGSWGTLSEIALAMRAAKPTFVLGGWDVHDPAHADQGPYKVSSPEEAVERAFATFARTRARPTR